ncbi:MAG: hypothetical protein AAFX79_04600 [Planctomycetota bacterium]
MNWIAFGVVGYGLLGIERGARDALAIGPVQPSFLLPLAVYVALSAPPVQALWACLLIGLAIDLTGPWSASAGGVQPLIGAHALGYVLLAQLALMVRGKLVRNHLATMAVLAFIGGIAINIVVVALLALQRLYGSGIATEPLERLVVQLGASAYTAFLAVPMGFALAAMAPLFGFQSTAPRSWMRRA